MSSVFKVSCAFYWIVWIICLSYAMGIGVYERRYVIYTAKYSFVTFLIKLLCVVHACMSFVGCVFVKCDITHILCCLCFVMPMGVVVPGVCIYGITANKELIANPPSKEETKEIVRDYLSSHNGRTPGWVRKTEEDYQCCGIFGYEDYQDFKFRFLTGHDVPKSCCPRKHEDCIIKFTPGFRRQYMPSTMPSGRKGLKKKQNKTDNNLLRGQDTISDVINTKGCFNHLIQNTKDTYDAHAAIYILILICSLLMSLIYMQNFCTYGPCRDEAYLHSLDVEELPYMEVKVPVPDAIDDNLEPNTPIPPPTPARNDSINQEMAKWNPNNHRLSNPMSTTTQFQDSKQKKANRPAALPPSVADSLTHKRLRKYM